MHLHGFYYRVDGMQGPFVDPSSRPAPGQLVVTELLSELSGMSMTWSPQRPGNWLRSAAGLFGRKMTDVSGVP